MRYLLLCIFLKGEKMLESRTDLSNSTKFENYNTEVILNVKRNKPQSEDNTSKGLDVHKNGMSKNTGNIPEEQRSRKLNVDKSILEQEFIENILRTFGQSANDEFILDV